MPVRPAKEKNSFLFLLLFPDWIDAQGRARMRARPRLSHGRDHSRTRDPREQQKTFFGDFLPSSKKLPAPWSGSFALREK
jgi:hypothetical protein